MAPPALTPAGPRAVRGMICGMRLSTNPAVWRVALGLLVTAAAQVGLISAAQADKLDGTLAGGLQVLLLVLPLLGAWLSKAATLPVPTGSPAVKYYERGADDVYRPAGPGLNGTSGTAGHEREQQGYEPRGD